MASCNTRNWICVPNQILSQLIYAETVNKAGFARKPMQCPRPVDYRGALHETVVLNKLCNHVTNQRFVEMAGTKWSEEKHERLPMWYPTKQDDTMNLEGDAVDSSRWLCDWQQDQGNWEPWYNGDPWMSVTIDVENFAACQPWLKHAWKENRKTEQPWHSTIWAVWSYHCHNTSTGWHERRWTSANKWNRDTTDPHVQAGHGAVLDPQWYRSSHEDAEQHHADLNQLQRRYWRDAPHHD